MEVSYELSPMQAGMLFQSLYAPRSGVNLEQIVGELREDLDMPAFQRAWEQVVARHDVLRTGFAWHGLQSPRQRVRPQAELRWEQHEFQGVPADECDQRLADLVRTERFRDFDLDRPPLMRLALVQLGAHDWRLIWTFHHALLDGRSFALILNEVFAIYDANRRGEELALPAAPPYRAYLEWLGRKDFSASERFWRERLNGFATATPLVVDQTPPVAAAEGEPREYGEHFLQLSETLTGRLHQLAGTWRVTLNTCIQGAWAVLLARYSGEEDVVFGATRACRHGTVDRAETIAGVFINTLPVRVGVAPDAPVGPWLQALRGQQVAVRDHEHTPLALVQQWSDVPRAQPLFHSLVVFERRTLDSRLRAPGGPWLNRRFRVIDQTGFPLTVFAYGEPRLLFKFSYDPQRLAPDAVARLAGHLERLLEGMAENPERRLGDLPLLTEGERGQLLMEWNRTSAPIPAGVCIHELIEQQAARTPDAIAVVCGEESLSYRELDRRAGRLARHLQNLGVGPDVLVGVCLEVSLELPVALLGVLKAGGAYVPLDPAYPRERLAFMIEDARLALVLTQAHLAGLIPVSQRNGNGSPAAVKPRVVCLDAEWDRLAAATDAPTDRTVYADHLAYVLYTSGSTGQPKGVMITHRNVVNFFTGMDQRLGTAPGVWLAVTSIAFDISVLELFWTLARGFKVVLQAPEASIVPAVRRAAAPDRRIAFSLFYFASDESAAGAAKYRLLLEGAKFADRHGFAAVWTPERHFHAFGGLYPNPSVTSAAVAAVTERVRIRAGSVVLPLHHPIRVAEEWAVVDNLSNGRVGISFASGWQVNDFVLAPERYAARKEALLADLNTVRELWRGRTVAFRGPDGRATPVRILPRPVQPELPVWLTAAGSPDTFKLAGQLGTHLLTHLLGQSLAELAEKIARYRQAWRENGHAGDGQVTLMLHTFVDDDPAAVRERVRGPFTAYLKSSVDLIKAAPWAFPTRKLPEARRPAAGPEGAALTDEDMDALAAHAFERYFETSGLFGTPAMCRRRIEELRAIGVDEVACLIDFGVEVEAVLASLARLDEVREQSFRPARAPSVAIGGNGGSSLAALIARHGVTHLQCTPALATLLARDPEALAALRSLKTWVIGGEPLTASLLERLDFPGTLVNAYGPTETTVWSTTHVVRRGEDPVPIGRPIANTEIYLLDPQLQPVPIGVPGELCIGGAGVARGYLNRPELTVEKFIPHPFRPQTGARVYRTGDRARYRADGVLEFLGRLDHQVKLRGFRVELGEVEAVLRRHPAVQECAAVVREDTPGDQRLVAYVVPRPEHSPDAAGLRDHLGEALPDYMVPGAFVFLEALPLTPNRKVDRRALPAPETRGNPPPGSSCVPPHSPLEQALARIWCEALGLKQVSVHGNFFDLGGHSLLAAQVVAEVRQALGQPCSLVQLFRCPTIHALARALGEASSAAGPTAAAAAGRDRAQRRQQALKQRRPSLPSPELLPAP